MTEGPKRVSAETTKSAVFQDKRHKAATLKAMTLSAFTRVPLAAVAAVLAACAAPQTLPDQLSVDIAAMVAAMPIVTTPVFVSDFDAMRAALPAFDLQRGGTEPASRREVSVVRDLVFAPASSILSRADVIRLQPLLAYLRANPTIAVRIEGFGDGINSTEHDTELSLSRAQAVARALLTDMMVSNAIVTVGAPVPQLMKDNGRAEIIFIGSAADYAL